MEFNPPCQPGKRLTATAATSGQTTRDGTEDFSAQVWQWCLAANLSAIRRPYNIGLGVATLRGRGQKVSYLLQKASFFFLNLT